MNTNENATSVASEAAVTTKAPEIISDKLLEIRKTMSEAIAKLQAGGLQIAEIVSLSGEIGKLQSSEAAEIAAIKKQQLEAEIAAANTKRVAEANATIDSLFAAFKAAEAIAADKKASIDDKNAANSEYVSQREKLVNVIIGKAPKLPAAAGANSGKTAAAGAKDADIQTKYSEYVASGKSEIEAKKTLHEIDGFAKSTIWFSVDRLKNQAKYAK